MLMRYALMQGELSEKIFKQLLWDPSANPGESFEGAQFPFLDTSSAVTFDPTLLLQQLYFFESVRSSMVTALTLVHEYQASVRCWGAIFFFLSCLHDCALLPEDMVIEVDADLLPPHVRDEFEMKLLELERKRVMEARPTPSKRAKKSASILSLQGLGEALFGSSSEVNMLEQGGEQPGRAYIDAAVSGLAAASAASVAGIGADDMSMEEMLLMKMDALSARWDAGYELQTSGVSEETKGLRSISHESISSQDGVEQSGYFSVGDAVKEIRCSRYTRHMNIAIATNSLFHPFRVACRAHSARSGIVNLVSGTRFLSESKLTHFLKVLVRVTEVKEAQRAELGEWCSAEAQDGGDVATSYSLEPLHYAQTAAHVLDNSECFNRMVLVLCNECEASVYASQCFSTSSIAWLEMLLIEVSLRNRDRFTLVWPQLKGHYVRGLSGRQVALSYVTERRVTGLLKVSARLIGRESHADTILDYLGQMFALRSDVQRVDVGGEGSSATASAAAKVKDAALRCFPPIPSNILIELSNQVRTISSTRFVSYF